jgi:voltage-gated potassium channel Kch
VVVRAHDQAHAQQLRHLGATATVAEAAESSLQLGALTLTTAGSDPQQVQRHVAAMREEVGAMLGIDAPAPPKRLQAAPSQPRSREKETEGPVRPTSGS